ncbi:MAG TPA: glutamyl-tRNA reductase [Vicinamibacterales bacterium]|nr:glutamyl-tRNA reductase [Vicinamibacterales bacterium]
MHLLLVGASHRTAPVELRERLDFGSRGLDAAVRALAGRRSAAEAVVISTCNRAELYVVCEQPTTAVDDLVCFIADFHQLPAEQIRPHLYSHIDHDAARHLFRVSSGLDSMVVGEPQILGQIKEAYGVATTVQTAGPLLNKLFHWAFGVGKRVRTETALAEGAVSVSFAAVSLAKKIFGNLSGRRVLVVGTGEMGKLTAIHLKAQGVESVVITSRTLAHAQQLAEEVAGTVAAWDSLPQALLESDIVITSTGSSTPILSKAQVKDAVPASRVRPLFLIDIAVPRDVDPRAAEIEQVFLYNIDDLQSIVRENLQKRGHEVSRAEQIVEEEVTKFATWHRSREAVPTIVALRQRFEAVRKAELERLEPKLASLSPEARTRVEDVTRLIIEKLLLQPTEQLKHTDDRERVAQYTEALTRLFGLDRDR